MSARMAAALLAGALIVGCGGGGGTKVLMRFHPPAGAVYHYTVEQNTQITARSGPLAGLGQQQLTMRVHFTQTVKGRAMDGGTEVQVVFDSTTMQVPGMPADAIAGELAKTRGLRSTVVFDDRGRIMRSDVGPGQNLSPQLVNQLASGFKSMSFGFPEQPIRQGDSWSVSTELPLGQVPGADASQAGPAKTTLTVREIRISGGGSDTSVFIDIRTAFPTGPIQLSLAGQQATLKLAGEMTGDQQFSISRGAVVDGSMKGTMMMHIAAPAMGMPAMDMSTTSDNSIRLVDTK